MAVLPRAGRRFFLGGDWLQAGKPYQPMDAWKADLLGLERSCNGRLNIPSLPARTAWISCTLSTPGLAFRLSGSGRLGACRSADGDAGLPVGAHRDDLRSRACEDIGLSGVQAD